MLSKSSDSHRKLHCKSPCLRFFHFEEMTRGGYIVLLLSQNVNKNKVTTLDPVVRENTVLMHTTFIARLSK